MKRFFGFVFCFALIAASVQARDDGTGRRFVRENLTRAAVQRHCYEFSSHEDTPAPEGFKPFYISHYGRHGSRSNWGDKSYRNVIAVLSAAREEGILSPAGDSLLREAEMVLDGYDGMDGRLTSRGVREHRELGGRFYDRFGDIFSEGNFKVRVETSNVPRCIMSMASFTNALTAKEPRIEYTFDTGEKIFAYISNSPDKPINDSVSVLLGPIKHSVTDTVTILSTLFTDTVRARALIPGIDKFQSDIWETAAIADDFDIEPTPFRFLPFDVVWKYYDYYNREVYLKNCNSIDFGDRRMALASPLVENVVKYADSAIERRDVCADLKFGHDFPLLAFASRLGIKGLGDRLSLDEIPDRWFGGLWICMASNVDIVFYRNAGDEVIVKVLYNENEYPIIGLTPVEGTSIYYRWTDLRRKLLSSNDFVDAAAGGS